MILNLKAFSAFLMTFLGALAFSFAGLRCEEVLSSQESLLQSQFHQLAELHLRLEQAKIQGEQSVFITALKSDYAEKVQKLRKNFSADLFKSALSFAIRDLQAKSKTTDEKRKESEDFEKELHNRIPVPQEIVFFSVKPGFFKMGPNKIEKEITKPFLLMATPMTQMIYARIMIESGETNPRLINPSMFTNGENEVIYSAKGIDISMRPDDPVQNMTYFEADNLVQRLNTLSVSADPEVQIFLKNIIPEHQPGDRYELPSRAQLEFARQKAKTLEGDTFDELVKTRDYAKLSKYARHNQTNLTSTVPVCSTLPLYVDGSPFFLVGNIRDWTTDTDELGQYIQHGSYWNSSTYLLVSTAYEATPPETRSAFTGLRLIRIPKAQTTP